MEDRYGRKIDYLRISVTDRCNLRCLYCMPAGGVKPKPRQEILRFEEILAVAEIALEMGIDRIRLTGGEPLLRRGIIPFIRALALLPGLKDLAITTNGQLLTRLGEQLKEAGVKRLNISLDTLDPDTYRRITRGGDLKAVLDGIDTALRLGFHPVKINAVALEQINDRDWVPLARLTLEQPLHIRFIELMPIGSSRQLAGKHYTPCERVKERIEKHLGPLTPEPGIRGNGPAEYHRLAGAKGTIGLIHPISNHFCAGCNRLRLTADGKLRPCLHDRREIDLKEAIRSGAGREQLRQLLQQALQNKPADYRRAHTATAAGRGMVQIGG